MKTIPSSLTGREFDFGRMKSVLESHEFTLGGNWEYDRGSFDRALDGEARKVWLRLPFDATRGSLDSEKTSPDTIIRMGSPFVLKHVYQEGNDAEAEYRTYGALFDQFQEPADPDAAVEPAWFNQGKRILDEVERRFVH